MSKDEYIQIIKSMFDNSVVFKDNDHNVAQHKEIHVENFNDVERDVWTFEYLLERGKAVNSFFEDILEYRKEHGFLVAKDKTCAVCGLSLDLVFFPNKKTLELVSSRNFSFVQKDESVILNKGAESATSIQNCLTLDSFSVVDIENPTGELSIFDWFPIKEKSQFINEFVPDSIYEFSMFGQHLSVKGYAKTYNMATVTSTSSKRIVVENPSEYLILSQTQAFGQSYYDYGEIEPDSLVGSGQYSVVGEFDGNGLRRTSVTSLETLDKFIDHDNKRSQKGVVAVSLNKPVVQVTVDLYQKDFIMRIVK